MVAVPCSETAGQDGLCCPPVEGSKDEKQAGGFEGPGKVLCDMRTKEPQARAPYAHFLHNSFSHYQI